MTRNGKIARLPQAVRRELNQRLDDGEPGTRLVAWLNGLAEVKAVLARDFQGKAVTEQNLSEWRQGGFLDWQRHQESLECVRTAAEQSQELAAEAGPVPLTEVLSASVALLLTKLIREVESGADATPGSRRELVTLVREWTAVRQGDHKAARLKMRQDDWSEARAKVAEAEARAAEEAAKAAAYAASDEGIIEAFDKTYEGTDLEVIREFATILQRNALIDRLCRGAGKDGGESMRKLIEDSIQERREERLHHWIEDMEKREADRQAASPLPCAGAAEDATEGRAEGAQDRTESEWIRPDPTEKIGDGHESGALLSTQAGCESDTEANGCPEPPQKGLRKRGPEPVHTRPREAVA